MPSPIKGHPRAPGRLAKSPVVPSASTEEKLGKLLKREGRHISPDSARYKEIQEQAYDGTFGENYLDGVNSTALSSGVDLLKQEIQPMSDANLEGIVKGVQDLTGLEDDSSALNVIENVAEAFTKPAAAFSVLALGNRAGGVEEYKEEHYDNLIAGIPSQYHDEIFQADNLNAALRARKRIIDQLQRGHRISMQKGLSDNAAILLGSLVEVDIPLVLMTGGGFKAAQVAGKVARATKAAKFPKKLQMLATSAAVGANAGAQAGAAIGVADAAWTETRAWTGIAEMALLGTLLGAGANTILRADRQLAIKAAQDDLHAKIATNDPSLDATVDVGNYPASPIRDVEPPNKEYGEGTVGAAFIGEKKKVKASPKTDPASNVGQSEKDFIEKATEWRHNSGWEDQKVADMEEFWSKVALSDMFSLTTGDFRKLYKSDAAVLNWLAGNVYESPHGLGRGKFTAAAGMEFYHRKMVSPVSRKIPELATSWAKHTDNTWKGSGYGISQEGVKKFNREAMLEMNERRMGRSDGSRTDHAGQAANAYGESAETIMNIARGEAGQHAVDGFDQIKPKDGYFPQIWSGVNLLKLEKDGVVKRKDVVAAMAEGYRKAGMADHKDASVIARAVIARAVAKEVDVDTSMIALLSGDGRNFLKESLLINGHTAKEADDLIERLTGLVEERGKEGFAKHRNDIDIAQSIPTLDGSDVKIVDLLDLDLASVWQRYARRMAGSSALARVGITNRAQRETVIQAALSEQRALGEDAIEGSLLRAMFTHFDGGPVHGHFRGQTNPGIGAELAIAKRITNLALLNKLGFAQLAETGATIGAVGLETWWRRGFGAKFSEELKKSNSDLLDDVAFILGDLGHDHKHFAEWLDLDDVSLSDRSDFLRAVGKLSSQGQYIQGYTSLFNLVRSYQQKVATMGIIDKIFRTVKEASTDAGFQYKGDFVKRLQSDLGLDAEDLNKLEGLVSSGIIEFGEYKGKTYVNRIHMDKWDTDIAEIFGSSLTRNMNQVVQRSMAGEQDALLHTHVGSMMTHLKTFPLLAMQKQFIRNLRHSDNQSLATVMFGAATAMVAIGVRDALDGKDRTLADSARMAFGYSNMTGWIPMFYDPAMTALGLEDHRINAFGPHSTYTPPVITQLNRSSRLPGAIIDTVTGEADWYDKDALKALPFDNMVTLARITD